MIQLPGIVLFLKFAQEHDKKGANKGNVSPLAAWPGARHLKFGT